MRPAFEMSQDARLLYGLLQPTAVGQVVTYAQMSQAIGRVVDGSFGPLRTAIRACSREHGMDLATVVGIGVKRLSDEEITKTLDQFHDRVDRAAKRQFKRITRNVQDFDGMPAEVQAKYNAGLVTTALVSRISSVQGRQKIEAVTAVVKKELPMRDALRALGLVGESAGA